jgi:Zn-dependent M28 family amino/carboxypeptidase
VSHPLTRTFFAVTAVAFFAFIAGVCVYVTQPAIALNAGTGPLVDARSLEAHVRMLSETLLPRDEAHRENLDRVATYVAAELGRAGGRVEQQVFQVDKRTYRNVVARFGPQDGEIVVVGAHYDAFGPFPGADDNASGVAGLIELGRLLGRTPPPRPVQLVAYSLEEPPYFRTENMGSAVHAAALQRAGTRVRAMLSLEMIGYFSDAPDSQEYPLRVLHLFYPDRGNFIAVVGRFGETGLVRSIKRAMSGATTLPVRSITAPAALAGVDFSDHLNYWERGMAAVMVTDTAFFRNRSYHTKDDIAERLDYERMAKVVAGVFAAVQALAAGD